MAQRVPMSIGIAPFPEGFEGDHDETFQQAVQLMEAFIEGNFLTGLILAPGSTLPTTDQGPVAMGNQWYFWDAATSQYLPQTVSSKIAKNYVKNCTYQVQQVVVTTVGAGMTKTFDMAMVRSTLASVLAIAPDTGPAATPDNDYCPAAIKYTVGPTLVPTLGASDIYLHEHLIEGIDLAMIQGQLLSLSFSVWCNVPGTYSVYLTNGNRDQSYVVNFAISAAQASSWIRVKIPAIPAVPTAGIWSYAEGTTGLYIGFAMGIGSQWRTASPNQWNSGFFGGTSQNSNLCTVSNNQMKISGIKLEASAMCSYLTVPPFGDELFELIRYYFTTFTYQSQSSGAWSIITTAHVAGAHAGTLLFPRRMAKIPIITPYSVGSVITNTFRNLTTSVDATVFAAPVVTMKGVTYNSTVTTPATAKGDVLAAFITADARLT